MVFHLVQKMLKADLIELRNVIGWSNSQQKKFAKSSTKGAELSSPHSAPTDKAKSGYG